MSVKVATGHAVRLWLPRQHGAWAMLVLPILVGVAASRFVPTQVLLAATAGAAYLTSTTLQAWLRSRRRSTYVPSIIAYGAATIVLALPTVVVEPRLLLALLVEVPVGGLTLAAARPGRPRELALSLAQVAQAVVLAPAAMLLAGEADAALLAAATVITGAEMVGSVLAVRSVIRERDNPGSAVRSVGYHATLTVAAFGSLPFAYAALGAGLTIRAAGLPVARRLLVSRGKVLRPVWVGLVETLASTALVAVAFAVPLAVGHR